LFEKGGWRSVDAILVVSAPAWMQRRRVLSRPGMTPARFARIKALQTPDREKRRLADFVISTAGEKRATRAELRWLIACLAAHGVRYCRRCARSSSTPKPPV
jgi:dephospho-CoA kinase